MPLARGQKFLFGCLAVFGAIVFLVIVAGGLFIYWIRTPGVPLEGSRLMDPGTAVYAELRLRTDDPGAREFVRAFMTATRRPHFPAGADVPGPISYIVGNIPQKDATDREVDKILPIVLVVRRQEGKDGNAEPPLFAVSFSRAGNSVRMIHTIFNFMSWRGSKIHKEAHGAEDVFRLEEKVKSKDVQLWVSFFGTDVLIARDAGAVASGIDAMSATAAPEGAARAASLLSGRPADSFLYLNAKPGYADAALETIEAAAPSVAEFLRPLVKGGSGVTLWGSLRSADLLEGEVRVKPGKGGAGAGAPEISGKMTLVMGKASLDVALDPIPPGPGERNAWKMRIDGLQAALHQLRDNDAVKIRSDF